MKRQPIADGISLIEQKAFQSFITRFWGGAKKRSINVPPVISKHLSLQPEDILEVAIRKVTIKYAKENYGIDFLSFRLICPKCGKEGIFHKIRHSFVVHHYKPEQKIHFLPKEVAQKLIEQHEKEEEQKK